MKNKNAAQKKAMEYIAAYDRPDSDEYEKKVVSIAKKWLNILNVNHSVQKSVNLILEDLNSFDEDAGCGLLQLKKDFIEWGIREEWIKNE